MAERARAVRSEAEARWAGHVARLGKSGLSLRKFAAKEGLKAGSLSFWKWKLSGGGRRPPETRVAPLRFVELTAAAPSAPVLPATRMGFEVVLRSGRTVRVAGGFDAGELVRLVGVLEEAHS